MKEARSAAFVLALCLASLWGWQPVSSAEQVLSNVLRVGDGGLAACLPSAGLPGGDDARERRVGRVDTARGAWEAWSVALAKGADPTDPGREVLLAPVVERRPERLELVLSVPPGAVRSGAAVTHHGVLLGFLAPWRRAGRDSGQGVGQEIGQDGRVRVVLLGHTEARPVAAIWRRDQAATPVRFLLTSGEHGPTISQEENDSMTSSSGQLAWTRDVSGLGDPLPVGLIVGRVLPTPSSQDRPGGGLAVGEPEPPRLDPIVDPDELGYVVVEAERSVTWHGRQIQARVLASSSRRGRLRLDRGRADGILPDDLVEQDGVFIGVIETAGLFSSLVRCALPPGHVLVVDAPLEQEREQEPGHVGPDVRPEVVSTTRRAEDWPEGWLPRIGQLVVTGHRELGGLLAGRVSEVGSGGFGLTLERFDPDAPVRVLER